MLCCFLSPQSLLVDWLQNMADQGNVGSYSWVNDQIQSCYGALWICMTTGNKSSLISYVNSSIRGHNSNQTDAPSSQPTMPQPSRPSAPSPARSHPAHPRSSLAVDSQSAAIFRSQLIFIPERGWPSWVKLDRAAWEHLLQVGELVASAVVEESMIKPILN